MWRVERSWCFARQLSSVNEEFRYRTAWSLLGDRQWEFEAVFTQDEVDRSDLTAYHDKIAKRCVDDGFVHDINDDNEELYVVAMYYDYLEAIGRAMGEAYDYKRMMDAFAQAFVRAIALATHDEDVGYCNSSKPTTKLARVRVYFVGRPQELLGVIFAAPRQELDSMVGHIECAKATGEHAMLCVEGLPGVGKTALSTYLACRTGTPLMPEPQTFTHMRDKRGDTFGPAVVFTCFEMIKFNLLDTLYFELPVIVFDRLPMAAIDTLFGGELPVSNTIVRRSLMMCTMETYFKWPVYSCWWMLSHKDDTEKAGELMEAVDDTEKQSYDPLDKLLENEANFIVKARDAHDALMSKKRVNQETSERLWGLCSLGSDLVDLVLKGVEISNGWNDTYFDEFMREQGCRAVSMAIMKRYNQFYKEYFCDVYSANKDLTPPRFIDRDVLVLGKRLAMVKPFPVFSLDAIPAQTLEQDWSAPEDCVDGTIGDVVRVARMVFKSVRTVAAACVAVADALDKVMDDN